MSGPHAKPRTKIDTTKVANVGELVLKSSITSWTPGAIMEETRGLLGFSCCSSVLTHIPLTQ